MTHKKEAILLLGDIEELLTERIVELAEVTGFKQARHAYIYYRSLLYDVRDEIMKIKEPLPLQPIEEQKQETVFVQDYSKVTSYIVDELRTLSDSKAKDAHKDGQVYALKMLEGYLIGNK